MKQFNANINDELDREFRIMVGKVKGARKGAVAECVKEALEMWLEENRKFDFGSTPEQTKDYRTILEQAKNLSTVSIGRNKIVEVKTKKRKSKS